jgi:hypothetical protein
MINRSEFEDMLDELACELPQEFYHSLNGGIIISEEAKEHKESRGGLFVLGEYRHSALGRSIVIFYGSFKKVYGFLPRERLRAELRKTLRHEFRHHLESLAGERGLELEDEARLAQYLSSIDGEP